MPWKTNTPRADRAPGPTRIASFLSAVLLLAGCADAPVAPLDGDEGRGGEAGADAPALAVHLTCAVDVRAGSMECEPASSSAATTSASAAGGPSMNSPSMNLIVGSQHRFVRLANFTTPSMSGDFWSASIFFQNLTLQPFGTLDGTLADPHGVRVFFVDEPTNGVEVLNHDGEAAFLGSDPTEKYYEYVGTVLGADGILNPGSWSQSKWWTFRLNGASTFTFSVLVSTVVPDPSDYAATLTTIAAGENHGCGVDERGRAFCWGWGGEGRLGDGETVHRTVPQPVHAPPGVTFASVALGVTHTCADADDGTVYCWGNNAQGKLGNGTTESRLVPAEVEAPAGVTLSGVVAGGHHSCALDGASLAYCWGSGFDGQLGNGSNTPRSTPWPVTMPAGVTFTRLSAGWAFNCADGDDSTVYCWGSDLNGALGTGASGHRSEPTEVAAPPGVSLTQVATGRAHACAQGDDETLYCWGWNENGQLGAETAASEVNHPIPVVAPSGVVLSRPTAGVHHSCALDAGGQAYCWGSNEYGQLGDGTTTDRPTPVPVDAPPGVTFESLHAGHFHTCGMSTAGDAYCWGWNDLAQLGDGTVPGMRLRPVVVAGTRSR